MHVCTSKVRKSEEEAHLQAFHLETRAVWGIRRTQCHAKIKVSPGTRGTTSALTAKSKLPTISWDEGRGGGERAREKGRQVKENLQIMRETHRERDRPNG